MKKVLFLMLVAMCAVTGVAHAAIVVNGSFDEVSPNYVGLVNTLALDDLSPNKWDVFAAIPGWYTSEGSGIEVQKNTVVAAHSGDYYIELDSHANADLGRVTNSSMSQDAYLDVGLYQLSFYYRPRTNNTGDDNGVAVYLDEVLALEVSARTSSWSGGWQQYLVDFTVEEADTHTLTFSAFGIQNTLGGFIDTVSVIARPVPEPATMALFGLGLVGIASWRKK